MRNSAHIFVIGLAVVVLAGTYDTSAAPETLTFVTAGDGNTFRAAAPLAHMDSAAQAGCAAPPAPPQTLSGLVKGFNVTLTWIAPRGECAATGYVIEAGSSTGMANLAVVPTNAATTFGAAGIGAGVYFVRVKASNAFGISGPSNEIQLVIGAAPCGASLPPGWTVAGAPLAAASPDQEQTMCLLAPDPMVVRVRRP